MPTSLPSHVQALLRQFRRVQHAALGGLLALLVCSVLLLTTAASGGQIALLGIVLLGYVGHKLYHLYWTRWAIRQLRLEAQFLLHGPTPEELATCLRRTTHLWTKSLTFKGLKTLTTHPLRKHDAPQRLTAQFRRCFQRAFPARLPLNLLAFATVLFVWMWAAWPLFAQPLSASLLVSGALLLILLVAEVIQAVLCADLRDGVKALMEMLSAWTFDQDLDGVFQEASQKSYRHTSHYRSSILTPLPNG